MSDIKIGKPNLEVFAETLLLEAKKKLFYNSGH